MADLTTLLLFLRSWRCPLLRAKKLQLWTNGRLGYRVCVVLVLLAVILNGRLFLKVELVSVFVRGFYTSPSWIETGERRLVETPTDVYTSVTAEIAIGPHLTHDPDAFSKDISRDN